jgi:replicative DNA helicase
MIERAANTSNDDLQSILFNIDAEKVLLGMLLVNNENVIKVATLITPNHFYVPLHKKIYSLILDFVDKDLSATPITLKNYLNTGNDDNYQYVLALYKDAISATSIDSYVNVINECYLRRKLYEISGNIMNKTVVYDPNVKVNDIIEESEQGLFNLSNSRVNESGFITLKSGLITLMDNLSDMRKGLKKSYGVSSGFEDLDRILGGLQSSDLIILAARPSMGKTSLAINIAIGKSVAFFSLEMSTEQIATRMLSIRSGFSSSRIRAGEFENKHDFEKLCVVASDLNALPVYIDDTPAITIATLRSKARRLKRQHDIGLILVDYLQLLRGSSYNEGSRVQEIGEISQGLKAIAKELNIPVIALSQLSRAVESREDKRPQLSDLRESGNIEQDADVVMFIYRDEYYHARKEPAPNDPKHVEWQEYFNKVKNVSDIIISKQRNGAIGVIQLHFNSHTTSFTNMAKI